MLLPQGQEGDVGTHIRPQGMFLAEPHPHTVLVKNKPGAQELCGWTGRVAHSHFPEETGLENELPQLLSGFGKFCFAAFPASHFLLTARFGDTKFFLGNNFSQSIFSLDREAEEISRVISSASKLPNS